MRQRRELQASQLPPTGARRLRHEIAFREVNERIAELAGEWNETGLNLVICECGRVECVAALEITAAEYEAVRAGGANFVVSPGHEQAGAHRVIRSHSRSSVVEMLGQAGEAAQQEYPRQR